MIFWKNDPTADVNGAANNPGVGIFDWVNAGAAGADGRIYNGDRLSEKWGIAPYTLPAWYPTVGCRGYNSAALSYIGSYARIWSFSVSSDNNGLFLGVGITGVNPVNSFTRSYGFSVRCLHI